MEDTLTLTLLTIDSILSFISLISFMALDASGDIVLSKFEICFKGS